MRFKKERQTKDVAHKAVIFDMDGVIFDSERLWKDAFEQANEVFGLHFTEADRQACCGKDEQSIRRELKETNPSLPVDEYRDYMVRYVRNSIEKSGANVKEGFLPLTEWLRLHGYKLALATSSHKVRAELLFEKAKINAAAVFDGMLFGEDVRASKPNPEIFLKAAQLVNRTPANCIVLEDSLAGIEAARRGGIPVIMVPDLIEPTEEAQKTCLFVAQNLTEVLSYFTKEENYENNRYK